MILDSLDFLKNASTESRFFCAHCRPFLASFRYKTFFSNTSNLRWLKQVAKAHLQLLCYVYWMVTRKFFFWLAFVLLNSCSETVFVLFQLSLKTMVSYVIRPRNQSYLYYRLLLLKFKYLFVWFPFFVIGPYKYRDRAACDPRATSWTWLRI